VGVSVEGHGTSDADSVGLGGVVRYAFSAGRRSPTLTTSKLMCFDPFWPSVVKSDHGARRARVPNINANWRWRSSALATWRCYRSLWSPSRWDA